MMQNEEKIKVGISIGDINGIGLEIILKTFSDKRMLELCTPVIYASNKLVTSYKKLINSNLQVQGSSSASQVFEGKINLINVWKEDVNIEIGKATKIGGEYGFKSLDAATKDLKEGLIDVLVTAPINKDTIQSENFKFPGHTEYLESKLEGESLMILMTDELKIGLITGHIPISEVSKTITSELIKKKTLNLINTLKQDFSIRKPKIALLGLNPHCGDKGVIGDEDEKVIRPTIQELFSQDLLVYGPYSADSFFGSKTYKQFDAVLAMYHDQGLAPFKSIAFGKGVNYTAGLDKIRTSPDHGTAFEIAGKNEADETSFKEALFQAIKIFKTRNEYKELTQNVLKTKR